jgi:hypothetical protein
VLKVVQPGTLTPTKPTFDSLKAFEAEDLLSSVLRVLRTESARMRRTSWIVGGLSVGAPAALLFVLLLFHVPLTTALSVVGSLGQFGMMGLIVGILLCFQVTSRWRTTLRVGVWLAARVTDPASLPSLIALSWQARRADAAAQETLDAALVRLLNRWDPEERPLAERDLSRLLALARRGGETLVVTTLLTLGNAGDERVYSLARHSRDRPGASERVQVAARECLEALKR